MSRTKLVGAALFACSATLAAELAGLEQAVRKVATYKVGESRKALVEVEKLVRESYGKPAERRDLRRRLVAVIEDTAASRDGRAFACRALSLVGTAAEVPALAALLADEKLHHMARFALERIQDDAAAQALRDALPKLQGKLLVGVVNSLGERRDESAVRALARLVTGSGGGGSDAAGAAVRALGKIGGGAAAKALDAAERRVSADEKLAAAWTDAYITCADSLLASRAERQAAAMYRRMASPDRPRCVRFAALRGLVAARPDEGVSLVVEALRGRDATLQRMVCRLVAEVPGREATVAFAAELPGLPPPARVALIGALAARGDATAGPAVAAAAGSDEASVRLAALKALAAVGSGLEVPMLVERAARAKGDEQKAARECLARMRDRDVEPELLAGLDGAAPELRVETLRALAARRASGVVPRLLGAARDAEASVRVEALRALAVLAGGGDMVELVALLVDARDEGERREAEKAVAATVARLPEAKRAEGPVAETLVEALAGSPAAARASLLRVLARAGGERALGAVRGALRDADAGVSDAALKALADWSDPSPADDLLALARESRDVKRKIVALRGYVKMAALPGVPTKGRLTMYARAMDLAPRTEEKKLVLGGVASVASLEALAFAEKHLGEAALGTEAAAACVRIASAVGRKHKTQAKAALRKVLELIPQKKSNDRLRRDAKNALRKLGG